MPRQIIDTEASRPAYRRRVAVRWVIILLLFIVAVLAGVRIWQATRPRMAAGAALIPGKAALVGKQAPVPHFRRKDAA
ncbi:MAG: hypothetical protein WA629_11330 [Candidatus Aquilonibacter sp.]